MARAKRTARAEARQRYRAYLQYQAEGEGADAEQDDTPEPQAGAKSSRRVAPAVSPGQAIRPGQRLGVMAALKAATRPVHYLDDLRYAPTLILRTNAIWPAAVISLGCLAFGFMQTDFNGGGFQFLLSFGLSSPPLIQPMIAGFLAPRATWLAGIISSLISGACLEVLLVWAYSGHVANMPAANIAYGPLAIELIATAFAFGALLGAGSGWYKRFLSMSVGSSPRAQQRSSGRKPGPRRSSGRR